MQNHKIGIVLLVFSGCLAAFSCAKKEESFTVETVDGVRFVRNLSARTATAPPRTSFVVDLLIDGEADTQGEVIVSPIDIDADSAGNIYLLDRRDAVVRKLDVRGVFKQTFGRKGQGPGEFDSPSDLELFPDGRILVADPSQMRGCIFSSDGILLSTFSMENASGGFVVGRDGRAVAAYMVGEPFEYRVGVFNFASGDLSPVFRQEMHWPARLMNDRLRYDFPYLVRWAIDSKNRLIVGSAVAYEIRVLDPGGRTEFVFGKDAPRIPVEGEMKDKIAATAPQVLRFQKKPNPYLTNPYFPFFESLAVDERDRIWVQRYQQKWTDRINRDTPYDVFSPEGIFLFEARIAGHVTSKLVFKNGFIYVLKKSETGFPQVVRLKFEESEANRR